MCGCDKKSCEKQDTSVAVELAKNLVVLCCGYIDNMNTLLDKIEEDEELIDSAKFMTEQMGRLMITFNRIVNDLE